MRTNLELKSKEGDAQIRRSTTIWFSVLGLLLVSAIGATVSSAQVAVYHSPSDDGVNPGSPSLLPSPGPEWLHLYVARPGSATSTGTVCLDGDGNEICGWDVTIEGGSHVTLLAFQPAPGVVWSLTPTRLRANGVDAINPNPGPVRIGALAVFTPSGQGGAVTVSGTEAVNASLESEAITSGTVALVPAPEPGLPVTIAIGMLGLVLRCKSFSSTPPFRPECTRGREGAQ